MASAPPLPDSHLRIKAAMVKTAENEQRFRELAELLPETVYEMDTSGYFCFVNAKGLEQFGYSRADFEAGANTLDMIIAADHGRALANLSRALAGKRVYHSEYTCLRKDGSTFPGCFYSAMEKPLSRIGEL